jgi:hypothetical protein
VSQKAPGISATSVARAKPAE